MVIETLPTYEVDALDPSALPPRSRLYPLAPIGVGTPLVESLTSYVTRLAHAHGVTVEKLAATEIAPLVNKSAKMTQDEFTTRSQNLNSLGDWPPLAIAALERLTLRGDLTFLTLYPWRHVLSSQHLLHQRLAWCPACYSEWRQADQTLYHPLLWTLKLVQHCPQHQQPLCDRCPYPDCQKPLRLINSKVKLGYCPTCQRWLGLDLASASDRDESSSPEPWQLWLVDQLGRVLAAAPSLATCPEQSMVALNLKSCLKAAEPGSVQGLARQIGMSPSPLFGWLKRGHHPRLELLARVCYYLDLSLLDLLTPQPDRDYDQLQREASDQKQTETRVETSALRRRLGCVLDDPHQALGSAAQVARQLAVTPGILKHHCPTQYHQIIQRNEQDQQAKRQHRNEKLARDLQALLDSEESPPPSMVEVGRRLRINPRTARANCPELCRALSTKWKSFYETRQAEVEASLKAVLVMKEEPPPSLSQVAIRLGENINYLYRKFPALCRAVTRRSHQYRPRLTPDQAPKTAKPRTKSKDHTHLRRQFIALMAAETTPPPSLVEVSRQLVCSIATLRQKHPDLCRQLRQQWDTYRQRQRARLADELRSMLAVIESPPVREVAGRLGIDMSCLKRLLPDLYAEVVRRHQASRQKQRQRRQAFLDQVIAENPVPFPSLSQVADHLGCRAATLRRQFPEKSEVIIERYRAYRHQERAVAQAALEAALTDEQQPPQLPLHVARHLGYSNHVYVITYFPDLCHQLFQRYEAHRRQVAQARLEAILAEPSSEPAPALVTISRQLGYNRASLKYLCPELCQAIEVRHQTYEDEQKRRIKQSLEAILSGARTPPVSVQAVATQLGFSPGMVRRYFPELTTAVSAMYKVYARERGEQRRRRLDEAVKRMTRELYQAGIDPTLRQISLCLPNPKLIITPHLRQAWREARQELGLPT